MEAKTVTSKTLFAIAQGTHKVLRLYYRKEKWSSIYPTLVKLAQLYLDCYESSPSSMHGQLGLYSQNLGYNTNLVINQNVLVCMACHSLKFSRSVTEELLLASFADYLCVAKESDLLASGKRLNPQQEKLWQVRHQMAVQILSDGQTPDLQCLRILSRLSNYDGKLVSRVPQRFNDHASLIVAIAHRIASLITPTNRQQTVTFDTAIKLLYSKLTYTFAIKVLIALAEAQLKYPAGLLCQINNELGFLVVQSGKEKIIAVVEDGQAKKLAKANRRFDFRCGLTNSTDTKLLYNIWDRATETNKAPFGYDSSHLLETVKSLSHSQFQSIRSLEKLVCEFDSVSSALQIAAKQYNRENLKASSVRHSLAMVGLDAAGLLAQRVLLEQIIASHKLPFTDEILHKYGLISQIIALYVGESYGEAFERLLSPFAAVIAFLVLKQGVEIQHTTALHAKDFSEQLVSIANLFGIRHLAKEKYTEFNQLYFNKSILHKAMLDSEVLKKSQANEQCKLFIFIKLITLKVLSPHFSFTAWQNQLIDEVLAESRFVNMKNFDLALLEAGFYSAIA
ncbi:hypothetical protein [Pseudoalteromonas piscicida]|uniref:Uncharacterized protein n=1 Tax=Pseudoalteromonas piscicida TaxID=43662 RepID=A0A2A5JM30_PSEO7|nr:hypothetical protein [Pseudoalteromonas piscicida]PCK30485.1 hypothetical protein CEX98_17265 [Pseudoalteromonas piscicida]